MAPERSSFASNVHATPDQIFDVQNGCSEMGAQCVCDICYELRRAGVPAVPPKPLTEFKLIRGLREFIEPQPLAVHIANRGDEFGLSPEIECRP